MSYSILIPGSIAAKNIDAFNKIAKYTGETIENGNVIKLGDISSTRGEEDVYTAATPLTGSLDTDVFYMVYEPVIVKTTSGSSTYNGLNDDPRNFVIAASTIFNSYKPQIGDEIILSTDGIAGSNSTNTYIVPANNTKKLTWAADSNGVSLAYKLVGASNITVGSESVTAYRFICVVAS
jgi:hypothetical protein